MEIAPGIAILLPLGLGLLGFIEPCTVGGHLVFVRSLAEKAAATRLAACTLFVAVRTLVTGAVGVLAALLGERLIFGQTTLWLALGTVYAGLGTAYLLGCIRRFELQIRLVPASLTAARSPVLLGIVFGLNIPACAAPILFALIGVGIGTGSVAVGFTAMALFGLALSLPLFLFVVLPPLAGLVEKIGRDTRRVHLILGIALLILGTWSVWFGLFVDPADWTLS